MKIEAIKGATAHPNSYAIISIQKSITNNKELVKEKTGFRKLQGKKVCEINFHGSYKNKTSAINESF